MTDAILNEKTKMVLSSGYIRTLRILWGGRIPIIACTLVCAVAAGIVAMVLPKTFESSVSLILFPTPFKQAQTPDNQNDMSALIPKVLTVPDYEILLHSDGTLRMAADKVIAMGAWPDHDLQGLSETSKLRKRMIASIEVVEKTAYSTKHSPVIVLKARARTPEQARDLAQAWAEVSEELAVDLYRKGKVGLKTFVQERFDSAMKDLTQVRSEIRDIEIEWNDELEHERMAMKHNRLLSYEEKLVDLRMKIASTKEEIANLRIDLEGETEKKVLWKSPPMTALFLAEAKEGAKSTAEKPSKPEGVPERGYQEEVISVLYRELKQNLMSKETELAGMLEFEKQLEKSMTEVDGELQTLRKETAVRSFERKQLDMQEVPYKQSYDLLASKLEQAKIAESEQQDLGDIKLVSPAVLPDRKIRPMRSLIVLVAAFAGLALSTGAVFLRSVLAAIA